MNAKAEEKEEGAGKKAKGSTKEDKVPVRVAREDSDGLYLCTL